MSTAAYHYQNQVRSLSMGGLIAHVGLTSAVDPNRTWAAPDFRSAKVIVLPSYGVDTTSVPGGHMAIDIRRRELIVALGGVALWPLVVRAQQPAMPVIGFLNGAAAELRALPDWSAERPNGHWLR